MFTCGNAKSSLSLKPHPEPSVTGLSILFTKRASLLIHRESGPAPAASCCWLPWTEHGPGPEALHRSGGRAHGPTWRVSIHLQRTYISDKRRKEALTQSTAWTSKENAKLHGDDSMDRKRPEHAIPWVENGSVVAGAGAGGDCGWGRISFWGDRSALELGGMGAQH